MVRVVGVRFKAAGKVYYFDPADYPIATGEFVVVETARGVEYGEVAVGAKEVTEEEVVQPLKKVLRIGTEKDSIMAAENKRKEHDAFSIAQKKIEAHNLDMNLVDVEYTFDGSKVIFYFTAEGRIDFRELVRDLASAFRTRIEMRQIGVRDEAKMLGGLGPCGRILCCTSFLGDFAPVSIRMAKDQNLSLNPSKISGLCGRLMCCLRYEQDTYEAAKKDPTLAPGYVPPVVPPDEALPELARLEDPPVPRPGVRRSSVGGLSARIAQAVGLDDTTIEPEARAAERRSADGPPRVGQPGPERLAGETEGLPKVGRPQEAGPRRSRQPEKAKAGDRPSVGKAPSADKPNGGKGQEKQQFRQLPGEKLQSARAAQPSPDKEPLEGASDEQQLGAKQGRRRSRHRSRHGSGQGPGGASQETAVAKAPPERGAQEERSHQPERREGRPQPQRTAQGDRQQHQARRPQQGERARSQDLPGAQRSEDQTAQGERPEGARPHRRNRRGRRRGPGGGQESGGQTGGPVGGSQE